MAMCSLLTAAPCCCPMLPKGFDEGLVHVSASKRRCKTMAVTGKEPKKDVKCQVRQKEWVKYDESTSKSNGGTPLFFRGLPAAERHILGDSKRAESRLKQIEISQKPACCLVPVLQVSCWVVILWRNNGRGKWVIEKVLDEIVAGGSTPMSKSLELQEIERNPTIRSMNVLLHDTWHASSIFDSMGFSGVFSGRCVGVQKTPHRTTAKPTAGANHWVMEDQSRSTIHALGIDHGWQVDSDRCISIFHGNFPSPLQLQSSAFTSVDFPTQKLANQRCPLYTECYLISWSTRLRYLLFSRDLGHPWCEFDHFTFDPSAHFSGFGAALALGGYDDDASCAPPMVKTEGLMHQRPAFFKKRPGLRSNLPSKTNHEICPSHGNLLREKKEAIFYIQIWIHGFHHNTFWMPKFIKVYQSLSACHPWFSSQPLLNIFDQPFTLESIWSALPNPVLKQGKTQSDWWLVTIWQHMFLISFHPQEFDLFSL